MKDMVVNLIEDCRQTRSDKADLIKKCTERIAETEKVIATLEQDSHLTPAEKTKKIAHCKDIIANDKFTIMQTEEYLKTKPRYAMLCFTRTAR